MMTLLVFVHCFLVTVYGHNGDDDDDAIIGQGYQN
jgi:hypothetical protein